MMARAIFILPGKNVLDISIILLGPKMVALQGINKLGRNPDTISGSADASLQHVPDPQVFGNPLHGYRLTFVDGGRVAGDNEKIGTL